MRLVARSAVGIIIAVLLIGAAVLPLQSAWFTRELSSRYSLGAEAALSSQAMLSTAERVRAFVVEGEGTLPAEVEGRPGFDEASVGHLIDVRVVLAKARALTLLLALATVAWAVLMWRSGRRGEVGATLKVAGVLTVGLPAAAAAFAVADFDAFFAAFHGLLFADGTWVFPYESLLILTFPEPFWVACGVAWAVLVLAFGGVCFAAGAAIRAHEA